MDHRAVALLSGGIESLVTAALMDERGHKFSRSYKHGLFVDYGQNARDKERLAASRIARRYGIQLEIVDAVFPFLENHDLVTGGVVYSNALSEELGLVRKSQKVADRAHVVPYRNLVFTSMAASFASSIGADEIWVGFDYIPDVPTATADKSPKFVEHLNKVFEIAQEDIAVRLITPLQGNKKVDTIVQGKELGVCWRDSWSCYNALDLPCGVCAQCLTRVQAFREAGIDEGVNYHSREFIREQLSY